MSARLGGLLLFLACVAAPMAVAQRLHVGDVGRLVLRDAVRADKRKYVASLMTLTDAEAKRFWPVYDKYQRDIDETNRERVVAVQEFMFRDKPVSNLAAKQYATRLLAIDEAEIKARRTMRNRVMRALPAGKAARYMMLEQKINAVQDYDLAATVPLVR
jgi:hypothetical protein